MSIYIPGMEMPTKQTTLTIFHNGYVAIYDAKDSFVGETRCVPVPPHGRLGDLDELAEKHRELAYELHGANYDFHMTAKAWVDNAPTIIPASEEGK